MSEQNSSFLSRFPLRQIAIEKIDVREENAYPILDINRLADSIDRNGLLQPIIVSEKNGRFQIVAGERRFSAFCLLNKRYKNNSDGAAHRFEQIDAIIIDNAVNEEQIYRETNDYTRQMTTLQRIVLLDPDCIDMTEPEWQEEFVRRVHGDAALGSWKTGLLQVKGNQNEKCKLIQSMLYDQNPDIEVSEKTIRNYLAFLSRCTKELRLATIKGKISIQAASVLSWNKQEDQNKALEYLGSDEFEDYLEEGKYRSQSEKKRIKRNNTFYSRKIKAFYNRYNKLVLAYKTFLDSLPEDVLSETDAKIKKELDRFLTSK